MSWLDNLKDRWNVGSIYQVFFILLVFACTGSSVVAIKYPIFEFFFGDGPVPVYATILYWILILPVYNVLLLFYGFIFGQFRFFWNFERRFFARIFGKKINNK